MSNYMDIEQILSRLLDNTFLALEIVKLERDQ